MPSFIIIIITYYHYYQKCLNSIFFLLNVNNTKFLIDQMQYLAPYFSGYFYPDYIYLHMARKI